MEENKPKCSSKKHQNINAIIFCKNCNCHFCERCEIFHSEIHNEHEIQSIKKGEKDIFTGLCPEKYHDKLEYFCRTHNQLCCANCIIKIKDDKNGQHSECETCSLNEIRPEKENQFNKDFNTLEKISNSLDAIINRFDSSKQKIVERKEALKKEIKTSFDKLRAKLNERENELYKEVEGAFNKTYFGDDIIKKSEEFPEDVKNCLESGNSIKERKNKNGELTFEIHYFMEFENKINKLVEKNKKLDKFSSNQTKIFFKKEEKNLNNEIKKFGNLKFELINNIKDEEEQQQEEINNQDNDEIVEENEFYLEFLKKRINIAIDFKDARFFNVNDITIKNVGKNLNYQQICFIKADGNSDEDIIFNCNNRTGSKLPLNMSGEFEPNNTLDFSIPLKIGNPQPEKTYKLSMYIIDQNGKILSKSIEISVKINKLDEMLQKKFIKANEIYEELKKKYPNNVNLINKEEIIYDYMNDKFDKKKFNDKINNERKEQDKKRNILNAEQIYKELNMDKFKIDRNEAICFIIEHNFDKGKIQKWINEKKGKTEKIIDETLLKEVFDKIDEEFDISHSNISEEEVKKKILEYNYDIEKVKKWTEGKFFAN